MHNYASAGVMVAAAILLAFISVAALCGCLSVESALHHAIRLRRLG